MLHRIVHNLPVEIWLSFCGYVTLMHAAPYLSQAVRHSMVSLT